MATRFFLYFFSSLSQGDFLFLSTFLSFWKILSVQDY